MCTVLNFKTKEYYFGRNLDLDYSYKEEVCVMPRYFSLEFRKKGIIKEHYAMIGMATVMENIPLFYDATNEFGVSMAGLNFPDNAYYDTEKENKDNICQFEFIPWILSQCKNMNEVKVLLNKINIINIPFNNSLPLASLHWMISYKDESIIVETMKDGLHIYDNPVGVLTNNPPFKYQLFNLNNYRNLNVSNGKNTFSEKLLLEEYCEGLGSLGLPGDVSSSSRFIRASFNLANSVCESDELSSISQFFHLLSSVEMLRGCCLTKSNKWDITIYSSCINTDKGLYYYKTYGNHQIRCIDMKHTDLNAKNISRFPLVLTEQIHYEN